MNLKDFRPIRGVRASMQRKRQTADESLRDWCGEKRARLFPSQRKTRHSLLDPFFLRSFLLPSVGVYTVGAAQTFLSYTPWLCRC